VVPDTAKVTGWQESIRLRHSCFAGPSRISSVAMISSLTDNDEQTQRFSPAAELTVRCNGTNRAAWPDQHARGVLRDPRLF
jgi:hypothetical protein